jgi:exodeoxyribonuclease VII small subunit
VVEGGVLEEIMSKKKLSGPASTSPFEELSYEQTLAELEEITRLLEENPPALEEMLALYERGQALAKRCADMLDQAELKVRQLSGEELARPEGE